MVYAHNATKKSTHPHPHHTHTHAHTPYSHTHTPLSHANTLDTDWPAPLGPMMPTTALGGIHENKIK